MKGLAISWFRLRHCSYINKIWTRECSSALFSMMETLAFDCELGNLCITKYETHIWQISKPSGPASIAMLSL